MDYKKGLEELILTVIHEGGSDLHLSAERVPAIRVSGELIFLLKQFQRRFLPFPSDLQLNDLMTYIFYTIHQRLHFLFLVFLLDSIRFFLA